MADIVARPVFTVLGLVYLVDLELAAGRPCGRRGRAGPGREIVDNDPVPPFAQAAPRRGRDPDRPGRRPSERSGPAVLVESLTDRELSILRMLPGTATQREIGAALFLSINTVKAYNKSLYRKLGVGGRQDAVRDRSPAQPHLIPDGVGRSQQRCLPGWSRRGVETQRPPRPHARLMDETTHRMSDAAVASAATALIDNAPEPIDVDRVIAAAGRAPSSHNTQPWRFRMHNDRVDVLADRTGALPRNDPDDRELTISCGAALLNLRAAISAAGRHADVVGGTSADHVASVWMRDGDANADTIELAELFDQIDRRRTMHGPYSAGSPLRAETVEALSSSVAAEGAQLIVIDDATRVAVAELVGLGDRRQFADRAWRRELASWMHRPGDVDGVAIPTSRRRMTRAAVTTFDFGKSTARTDEGLVIDAPFVGVITTSADEADDWLRAGQALERLLFARHRARARCRFREPTVSSRVAAATSA